MQCRHKMIDLGAEVISEMTHLSDRSRPSCHRHHASRDSAMNDQTEPEPVGISTCDECNVCAAACSAMGLMVSGPFALPPGHIDAVWPIPLKAVSLVLPLPDRPPIFS